MSPDHSGARTAVNQPPLAEVTGGTGGSPNPNPSGGSRSGIRDMMKNKNFKRGALVAAGVIAAGSVVQSRRREGSPPGRQSMYRN